MAKETPERETPEYNFDYRQELVTLARRKKVARVWISIASLLLTAFIIISFVSYFVGQERASAASIRLTNRANEISLAEMGFRLAPDVVLTESDLDTHHLVRDPRNASGTENIYWGGTRVSQQTFRFIVERSGHPEGLSLSPVTTRAYNSGDEIKLYRNYNNVDYYERHIISEDLVDESYYFGFNVLFKIALKHGGDLADYPFYFELDSRFQGYNDIDKAIRLGFESNTARDILRPIRYQANLETAGSINVGGRLNVRRQQNEEHDYYDYTTVMHDGKYHEIAFGDFEHELTDAHWEDTVFGESTAEGTRTAPHVHALKVNDIIPKKAHFKNSFRHYSYHSNVGSPIAYSDENGIVDIDIKIWLEGWDPASTNDIDGINFEADLGFMVRDKD